MKVPNWKSRFRLWGRSFGAPQGLAAPSVQTHDNPMLISLAFPPAAAVLMDVVTSSRSQLRQ